MSLLPDAEILELNLMLQTSLGYLQETQHVKKQTEQQTAEVEELSELASANNTESLNPGTFFELKLTELHLSALLLLTILLTLYRYR